VYASSGAVYGNAERLPLEEDLLTRPISPYGVSKLAGERYLEAFTRTWGLPTVALRYLNVFGPGQDPKSEYAAAIPRFIRATLEGRPPTVYGDGEQARDFVFVEDVCHANLLAADAPQSAWGHAFNIGSGIRRTVNEVLASIRSQVAGEHPDPVREPPRPGEVRDSWSDISRARAALGYEPQVPFEEGIARTIEAIRD
jgi:UDP-glucose 4-epimerase